MTKKEIKKQFIGSVMRGTGEAYLLQKAHPEIGFSAAIIKGSANQLAYEPAMEGSRAAYAFGLIKGAKKKAKVIKAVLKKLEHKKDGFGLHQLCDLAVLLFQDGYLEAKTALNIRYKKNFWDDYEWCGQDELMAIEGLIGVMKVAHSVGMLLDANKDDYESSRRVDAFQKMHPELNVYHALENAAKNNKYIRTYLTSILEHKEEDGKRTRKPRPTETYESLRKRIAEEGPTGSRICYGAQDLPQEDFEKLAKEFLEETNEQRQINYLKLFTRRPFPFDYHILLQMVLENKTGTRLLHWAEMALDLFRAADVRSLAIEKINNADTAPYFIDLLKRNYQDGDEELLTSALGKLHDTHYSHDFGQSVIQIYEQNPSAKCEAPLNFIYNHSNCSWCREQIVKLLETNNVLSARIRTELPYDCNPKIRAAFPLA